MHKCNTPGNPPQACAFPVVSHRLVVTLDARRAAHCRGVSAAPVVDAAHAVYALTHGDRYAARRAAFAAVDAQAQGGA